MSQTLPWLAGLSWAALEQGEGLENPLHTPTPAGKAVLAAVVFPQTDLCIYPLVTPESHPFPELPLLAAGVAPSAQTPHRKAIPTGKPSPLCVLNHFILTHVGRQKTLPEIPADIAAPGEKHRRGGKTQPNPLTARKNPLHQEQQFSLVGSATQQAEIPPENPQNPV